MKRLVCIVITVVLFMLLFNVSSAERAEVERLQTLQKEQEDIYYRHLGQWLSTLNRIYQKGHVITGDERETFKQLFDDLIKDVGDIVKTCADGDAEYWTYLFKADDLSNMNPDDFDIYAGIIEKTYNAYQVHQEKINTLKGNIENYWEIASKYDTFDRELYERALAIIKEIDNIIQELHPTKEMIEQGAANQQ